MVAQWHQKGTGSESPTVPAAVFLTEGFAAEGNWMKMPLAYEPGRPSERDKSEDLPFHQLSTPGYG